jgi:hypothetical protein
MRERYLKAVLTVIALELLWIGVREGAPPAAAQAQPTRVVITGIDIAPDATSRGALPLTVRSTDPPLRIQADRPIRIETERPLLVMHDRPVKVEADRPLRVEVMPSPGGPRPGL